MEKLKDMACIPTWIVAELLNKSEQYVRVGLQQNRLPFGTAVKHLVNGAIIFLIIF